MTLRRPVRTAALLLVLLLANCALLIGEAAAQAPKTWSSSEILLGLKKLNVLGSALYIAAHPDDENTRLIAYLANGRLVETGYLSATRGDGGQNLIGPELREGLGVIRTQELLAARRVDGGRQFFTRANDFGFSKTAQETFTIWDKEQVLADMVWVIRQRRPDVMITRFPPDARAGHGHHTASAMLAIEAFDAAADPKRFPEQLKFVQPWQAKRLLWNTGSFFVKAGEDMSPYFQLDAGGYNALLGRSYGEIAAESRTSHKSQGFGSSAQRGEAPEYFQLLKGAPAKTDLFDGVDLTWNRVPGSMMQILMTDLLRNYDSSNPAASVDKLFEVRDHLQSQLVGSDNIQIPAPDLFWFRQKLTETEKLIQACLGLYIEATATDAAVVSGGQLKLKLDVVNRGNRKLQVLNVFTANPYQDSELLTQSRVLLSKNHRETGRVRGAMTSNVFDPTGYSVEKNLPSGASLTQVMSLPMIGETRMVLSEGTIDQEATVAQPSLSALSQPFWLREKGTAGMYKLPGAVPTEKPDISHQYGVLTELGTIGMFQLPGVLQFVGRPENEPSAAVRVKFMLTTKNMAGEGTDRIIGFDVPVQYKHTDPVRGEIYEPLTVVPPVMVNIGGQAFVFADQQPKTVPVTLRAGKAGVKGSVALTLPAGWVAEPASMPFDLAAKDAEQTVQFQVRPGAGAKEGKTELRAVATVEGQAYSRGYQVIAYDHIPTQTLFPEATAPLVKLDLKRKGQQIGYLMGAGDEVPEALRQIGYTVTLLKPDELTEANLRRFDAVVLGVRAYNTVEQLKTRQPALLKYVENGGNVVVQYTVNRGTVLPEIGPYPLTLGRDRVTVEDAPVTLLNPKQPLLNTPNRISPADFTGWEQEQGLYYPAKWDPRYQTVISSHDPGEPARESAILVANYGKGHYIYTGLSFFRELPAGVPGAYRLLTNMVSLGK
ncbi:PIG-L family deacetylase [Hymenobacter sp. ISL-91]|uniref:PIG-L family deacetylase n=1 Tax=Hymenobacter sp. ISL-91 TaxID=2819151 RepID=UPI002035A67C|nr:PIG-L family deacetylase [Hymenobacter sp. ISL-91]